MRWAVRMFILATLSIGALQGAPVHAGTPPGGHLVLALAGVNARADGMGFTDWALLKAYEGVPSLTSAAPAGQRLRFMEAVAKREATFSAFGGDHFVGHATAWSFDSTDLDWEASTSGGSAPPAYELAFPARFSFAPLIARFKQRGFTQRLYHGVEIYSHALDITAEWQFTTDLAISNTAVIPTRHLLMLSASLAALHAEIDAQRGAAPSLAANQAVEAAALRLGTVATGMLIPGSRACATFDPAAALGQQASPAVRKAFLTRYYGALAGVHPYLALAVGYRREGGHAVGIIVMHYAAPGTARADLAARRAVAANGVSVRTQMPYRTIAFTLESASVVGNDIVLRVRPLKDLPALLVQMVFASDMAFAACGAPSGSRA